MRNALRSGGRSEPCALPTSTKCSAVLEPVHASYGTAPILR
jgi:hypothetical protein